MCFYFWVGVWITNICLNQRGSLADALGNEVFTASCTRLVAHYSLIERKKRSKNLLASQGNRLVFFYFRAQLIAKDSFFLMMVIHAGVDEE